MRGMTPENSGRRRVMIRRRSRGMPTTTTISTATVEQPGDHASGTG